MVEAAIPLEENENMTQDIIDVLQQRTGKYMKNEFRDAILNMEYI
jgi:hypothetical protein